MVQASSHSGDAARIPGRPAATERIPGSGGAPPTRPQPPRFSGRNRYSLFVVLLKVMLPALAAAMILLVIVWPQIKPSEDIFRIDVSRISLDQAESLSMLNPRFDGLDKNNRPFTVTADLALQETGDADIVDLELPKADMTLEDGTWLAIQAKSGRYYREAERVELMGDVILFHDKGFEVRTEFAQIDLQSGLAEGDQPVEGQGPVGTMNSEGFRIEDQGARVFFTGKSRMVMYPE